MVSEPGRFGESTSFTALEAKSPTVPSKTLGAKVKILLLLPKEHTEAWFLNMLSLFSTSGSKGPKRFVGL